MRSDAKPQKDLLNLKSVIFKQRLVELRIILAVLRRKLDRLAGVTVKKPGEHILKIISPHNALFLQRKHIALNKGQKTVEIILGIL